MTFTAQLWEEMDCGIGFAKPQEPCKHLMGVAVTDHKGLYDVFPGKQLQLSEKRSQVECRGNVETIAGWGITIRWVAGCYQLADPLTKVDETSGNRFRTFLKTNLYTLVFDKDFVAGKEVDKSARDQWFSKIKSGQTYERVHMMQEERWFDKELRLR